MKTSASTVHELFPDTHHDAYSRTTFGFWLFLLTDFVLFGTLFACYAVLKGGTNGGPGVKEIFHVPATLLPTLTLLLCSFTASLGGAYAHRKDKKMTMLYFAITFVLGLAFTWMECSDMSRLFHMGHSWKNSAFLSAYFTIAGTHALHLIFALLWTLVILFPLWREESVSHVSVRRVVCLKMFWQFLNIIWVFIYSFIYLMGSL